MHTFTVVLFIAAFVLAVPSFIRVMCGDFRKMFWSDVFFDVVVIAAAIVSRDVLVVVLTEIICNMIIGWMYQKRTDEIYKNMEKQQQCQQGK